MMMEAETVALMELAQSFFKWAFQIKEKWTQKKHSNLLPVSGEEKGMFLKDQRVFNSKIPVNFSV